VELVADNGSPRGIAAWVRSLGDARRRPLDAPISADCGCEGLHAGFGFGEFLDTQERVVPGKLEVQFAAMRTAGARGRDAKREPRARG